MSDKTLLKATAIFLAGGFGLSAWHLLPAAVGIACGVGLLALVILVERALWKT